MQKTGLGILQDSNEYTSQDSSSDYSDEEDDEYGDHGGAKGVYMQYSEDDSEIMRDSMVLMRESGQPRLGKQRRRRQKR